jgi:hypothetical protein
MSAEQQRLACRKKAVDLLDEQGNLVDYLTGCSAQRGPAQLLSIGEPFPHRRR